MTNEEVLATVRNPDFLYNKVSDLFMQVPLGSPATNFNRMGGFFNQLRDRYAAYQSTGEPSSFVSIMYRKGDGSFVMEKVRFQFA